MGLNLISIKGDIEILAKLYKWEENDDDIMLVTQLIVVFDQETLFLEKKFPVLQKIQILVSIIILTQLGPKLESKHFRYLNQQPRNNFGRVLPL